MEKQPTVESNSKGNRRKPTREEPILTKLELTVGNHCYNQAQIVKFTSRSIASYPIQTIKKLGTFVAESL